MLNKISLAAAFALGFFCIIQSLGYAAEESDEGHPNLQTHVSGLERFVYDAIGRLAVTKKGDHLCLGDCEVGMGHDKHYFGESGKSQAEAHKRVEDRMHAGKCDMEGAFIACWQKN